MSDELKTLFSNLELHTKKPKVILSPPLDNHLFRFDGSYNGDVQAFAYEILSRTPKGVWIRAWTTGQDKKFVNLEANKKWACPTQEEALYSFIRRKRRQIKILSAQLEKVQMELKCAESADKDELFGMKLLPDLTDDGET